MNDNAAFDQAADELERRGMLPGAHPITASVIYRLEDLTAADYAEAIEALQAAATQTEPDGRGCVVCGDSGHQAMHCHHNPLVMARQVTREQRLYRCFHCDGLFNDEDAREHFGPDERAEAGCLSPGTQLLRRVLFAARDLSSELVDPTDDAFPKTELAELNTALDAALGVV
jgi:hypothetical protein